MMFAWVALPPRRSRIRPISAIGIETLPMLTLSTAVIPSAQMSPAKTQA